MENCKYVHIGSNDLFNAKTRFETCINGRIPQSHQLPEGYNRLNYGWYYNVKLVNPELSSLNTDEHTADKALKFQNRFELEEDPLQAMHSLDKNTTWQWGSRKNRQNVTFETTCAKSDPSQGKGTWSATVEEPQVVRAVKVLIDTEEKEQMKGAKVYLNDDVLCGEVDQSQFKKKENFWIHVDCENEVIAESVSIVGDSGVSVCAVFASTISLNF